MGVAELDFATASEADLHAVYDVFKTWWDADVAADLQPDFTAWVTRRRSVTLGWGHTRCLVAREADQVVGALEGHLPDEHNTHIAVGALAVLPQWQGKGIGTDLLRTALELAGRTHVEGHAYLGTAGEHWAVAHGFRVVNSMTKQAQELTEPLPEIGEVPAGYELTRWHGRAPEHLLDAFVDGFNAMKDAPFGDTDIDPLHYTRDQVRQEETALLAAGVDVWALLALHDGKLAGMTVMHRYPARPTLGEQRETVVLPAHRGQGLGRLMKAALLRDVTGIDRVTTQTSSHNEHMLRVNHSLGYVDRFVYLDISARVADLRLGRG